MHEEREQFRKFYAPTTPEQFSSSLQQMTSEARAEFVERMENGYEHAKQTWAAEIAERVTRTISGEK